MGLVVFRYAMNGTHPERPELAEHIVPRSEVRGIEWLRNGYLSVFMRITCVGYSVTIYPAYDLYTDEKTRRKVIKDLDPFKSPDEIDVAWDQFIDKNGVTKWRRTDKLTRDPNAH